MPKLQDIIELPSNAAELLEAIGYLDDEDLRDANVEELLEELVKANEKLKIMPQNPTKKNVEKWRRDLGGISDKTIDKDADAGDVDNVEKSTSPVDILDSMAEEGEFGDDSDDDSDEGEDEGEDAHSIDLDPSIVNFEEDPEVQEMLSISPKAMTLDPSLIRRHKLAVADIPEGILLTQCEGEVEINVMTTARMAEAQQREAESKRTGLMASRIRSFDDLENAEHHIKPLDKGTPKESVSTSRALNEGLRPESRRFVRGVLHPNPMSVRVSAFFAVLVQLLLAANFIGIPWLLIHEHLSGDSMLWWVVGLASGLILSALCYLFWGLSARCRVCGQRQFAPKKCLKNKKAHHIPLIGYILPTALHAVFFKWFYCAYCGTAVRLRK